MANNKIKVGIIGLGMVGEPIRRWFEEKSGYKRGRDLFCYDVDSKKGYSDDVNKADVIFVSVPTPTTPGGTCIVSIVELAVAGLNDGKIVVVKSTVTPGTVERLQKKHPKKRLIFNPEFLTESQAWEDYLSPDRQIVGHTAKSISDSVEVLNLLPKKHFIRPWTTDYSKKSINSTEAEFGKYASNVFGYIKVIYGNILADMCYVTGKVQGVKVDYENIKELIGADLRIGPAWLNVGHGDYSGAGGYCLAPDERLFVYNSNKFKITRAKDISSKMVAILGWKNGKVIKDQITIMGKRVVDSVIKFSLSKGRTLAVTPDHLVIVSDKSGNLREKCAKEVNKNDYFPIVLDGLGQNKKEVVLDIYNYIDCDKERVLVEKVPQNFADKLRPHLTFYEHSDFKRRNWRAVPMKACLAAGIDISKLRIKTGTSGTWIPSTVRLDEDFARFIGYYLAEGCVTDNRVLLSFSVKESDLIEDVKAILNKWSINFSDKVFQWNGKPSVYTFKISSKILSSYFLKTCGKNSYDKQIPSFIFESNQNIKDNLLAGALRGDGSIERSSSKPGPYYNVNYATTSQILAEGIDLLFREKGMLSSIKKIHTAKTKVDAWSLNISELRSVQKVVNLFTERQKGKISDDYFAKRRTILSPAYKRIGNLAILPIKSIKNIYKRTEVVSLDTLNHLYITSWGILTHNCFPKDMNAFIAFGETLEKDAIKKKLLDKEHIKILQGGLAVLKAVRDYNETLVLAQGLNMEDVARHNKDVIIQKRKKIRNF